MNGNLAKINHNKSHGKNVSHTKLLTLVDELKVDRLVSTTRKKSCKLYETPMLVDS